MATTKEQVFSISIGSLLAAAALYWGISSDIGTERKETQNRLTMLEAKANQHENQLLIHNNKLDMMNYSISDSLVKSAEAATNIKVQLSSLNLKLADIQRTTQDFEARLREIELNMRSRK